MKLEIKLFCRKCDENTDEAQLVCMFTNHEKGSTRKVMKCPHCNYSVDLYLTDGD